MDILSHTGTQLGKLTTLGGPVVLVLIAMSIFALAIIIAKIWQFKRVRINDRRTARSALRVYRTGNATAAMTMARRSPNPSARVVARAIQLRSRADVPEPVLREELLQFGGDMLESLRGHLRPLEVIAALAPLLGLFGTVLGMIQAFQNLAAAGSQANSALLAGGIWEALLTTAVGLAVAMPVIVALNWLERIIDRLAHDMDSVATRVFTVDISRTPVHPSNTDEDYDDERPINTPFV
jgi:biopolymer transport protein ExbB